MKGFSQTSAVVSAGKTFFSDATCVLLHPATFYQTVFGQKNKRDTFGFLLASALLYSVGFMIFAPQRQAAYGALSFLNGALMPLINAAIVYLVLHLFACAGSGFWRIAGIAVYANAALLFAWIPGMAPFAEILKYGLMGTGLVKAGQMNVARAVLVILTTGMVLATLIYGIQQMI